MTDKLSKSGSRLMEITVGGGSLLLVPCSEHPCSHASVEQMFPCVVADDIRCERTCLVYFKLSLFLYLILTPDTIRTVSTLHIDNRAAIGFHQFAN